MNQAIRRQKLTSCLPLSCVAGWRHCITITDTHSNLIRCWMFSE